MSQEVEDFLAHHGVLGMKWGKHKVKPAPHPDHLVSRAVLKTRTEHLSTRQIQETNNRLNAEKQLRTLKAQNTTVAKGQERIKLALGIAGTIGAIYGASQTPLGKKVVEAGKNYISKTLSSETGRHVLIEGAKHLA